MMKKVLILAIGCCLSKVAYSQNVGVGTISPGYPLTVASNGNGNGLMQLSGSSYIYFSTNPSTAGWLRSSGSMHFATNNSSTPAMTVTSNGVGIGLSGALPAYMLDVEGRIRLQHNTSLNQTAGIWFDGTTATTRSFIGTINDDHVGIWGSGGAGWNFAMNVVNGNTGIGTASPTAKLDVNGDVRIRGSLPKTGSVLTSADANGTAEWQGPVAFRVGAALGPNPNLNGQPFPADTWTKVIFMSTPAWLIPYNIGLGYQPWASQFVVPVKGIYHFDVQMELYWATRVGGVRLAGSRNGNSLSLPYQYITNGTISISGDNPIVQNDNTLSLSTDIALEAGDIIWVNIYSLDANQLGTGNYSTHIFSGRLLTRL